jgi:hypothetical protein
MISVSVHGDSYWVKRQISLGKTMLKAKKKPTQQHPEFRDSIVSAYSLMGLPAFDRITLYLVIRKTSTVCRERIYSRLRQQEILGIPKWESTDIPETLANSSVQRQFMRSSSGCTWRPTIPTNGGRDECREATPNATHPAHTQHKEHRRFQLVSPIPICKASISTLFNRE